MARFTVRIELHGVTSQEPYNKLHDAMQKAGFRRVIQSGDGRWYSMPSAEYDLPQSAENASQVADRAFGIAVNFQPKLNPPREPWVFVTEGPAAWKGIASLKV